MVLVHLFLLRRPKGNAILAKFLILKLSSKGIVVLLWLPTTCCRIHKQQAAVGVRGAAGCWTGWTRSTPSCSPTCQPRVEESKGKRQQVGVVGCAAGCWTGWTRSTPRCSPTCQRHVEDSKGTRQLVGGAGCAAGCQTGCTRSAHSLSPNCQASCLGVQRHEAAGRRSRVRSWLLEWLDQVSSQLFSYLSASC